MKISKFINFFKYIVLQHPDTKEIKVSFLGYAWVLAIITSLFPPFGIIFAFVKKDYRLLLFVIITYIILNLILFYVVNSIFSNNPYADSFYVSNLLFKAKSIGFFIYTLIFVIYGFVYNKLFLKKALKQNYKIIYVNKYNAIKYNEYKSGLDFSEEEIKNYTNKYFRGAILRSVFAIVVLIALTLLMFFF